MSKYTTELRFICEQLSGKTESEGYNSIDQIIAAARKHIFSFDYPIFDDEYKATLENKIIKRYYTREICAETYGRWKLFLESRMQELMPFYNELYKTTLKDFDIFEDVNYTRTGNRSNDETGNNSGSTLLKHAGNDTSSVTVNSNGTDTSSISGTTTGTTTIDSEGGETHNTSGTTTNEDSRTKTGTYTNNGELWQKYSDTPQGSVQNIDNDTYLTNATKNTEDRTQTSNETEGGDSSGTSTEEGTATNENHSETVSSGTSTEEGTATNENYSETVSSGTSDYTDSTTNTAGHSRNVIEEYSEIIKGKYPGKSYMQLIQEFRNTLLNIDKMIIDELADLFMMVY